MIRVIARSPNHRATDEDLLHELQQTFPGPVVVNHAQHRGCAIDGWLNGQRIELKHDHASAQTGNLFIETHQTQDAWVTLEDSGVNLETDLFVVGGYHNGGSWFFVASPTVWRQYIMNYPRVETRPHINTNVPGMFASGHLVPVLHVLQQDALTPATDRRLSSDVSEVPTDVGG